MKKTINKLLLLSLTFIGSFTTLEGITTVQVAEARNRNCHYYMVNRQNGLYLYDGNQIIQSVPYRTVVYYVQYGGHWSRVRYVGVDGNYYDGWVTTKYLYCYS